MTEFKHIKVTPENRGWIVAKAREEFIGLIPNVETMPDDEVLQAVDRLCGELFAFGRKLAPIMQAAGQAVIQMGGQLHDALVLAKVRRETCLTRSNTR